MPDDLRNLTHRLNALEKRIEDLEDSPRIELPTEPLFDLRSSAMFVPMGYDALRSFLSRRKEEFPARYRLEGSGHRRVRLLSATEIRQIRKYVIVNAADRILRRR